MRSERDGPDGSVAASVVVAYSTPGATARVVSGRKSSDLKGGEEARGEGEEAGEEGVC